MRRSWPPWKLLSRRLAAEIVKDDVLGRSAQLAYFFLLSVFPLIIVLTTLLGMLAEGETIRGALLRYVAAVAPPSAFELVAGVLDDITAAAGGGKLSLGILATLVSASAGMVAIIEALNMAYGVREKRPWWKRRLVALGLTVTLSAFTIMALALVLYGNYLGRFIAARAGYESLFETLWRIAQWPVAAFFVLAAFALVYRFAPNIRERRWTWVIPGAVLAFLVWLLVSFGLRLYLSFFNSYDKVYGSLGAVIVLMLWFYLFGIAILVGGELNSVIENYAARAGDPDARLTGDRKPRRAG